MIDEGNNDNTEGEDIVENNQPYPEITPFTPPSFDSFDYGPKSVPYDLHIV